MPKTLRRTLTAATLAAILLLTLAPVVTAGPVDGGPSSTWLDPGAWLDWLSALWPTEVSASSDTLPNMDPDGSEAAPAPPTAPDAGTTSSPDTGDGEALPDMDPDG